VKRDGIPVVAVGAAACVACCAPPILGALGLTVGLTAFAGWLVGGVLLAATVLALGLAIVLRRRRAAAWVPR
jgi:hypothetical protein